MIYPSDTDPSKQNYWELPVESNPFEMVDVSAHCYCGACKAKRSEKTATRTTETRPMQQNLYEVAILKDTLKSEQTGEKTTSLLVSPTVVLAINPQVARDKAVLLIPSDNKEELDDIRVFVREFASSYRQY